jgi:salicylate hydroxylase
MSLPYPSYVTDSVQAHRRALLDIMTSFIPTENVRFDKHLTDIEQCSDEVVLRFADGEVARTSVLAGADGITSMVRKHVLEPLYPNEVNPVYADAYCYRGVIPIQQAKKILGDLTDVAKFYFGNKRSAVTYRISGGEVSWRMPSASHLLTR